jgi:hypothetical protein
MIRTDTDVRGSISIRGLGIVILFTFFGWLGWKCIQVKFIEDFRIQQGEQIVSEEPTNESGQITAYIHVKNIKTWMERHKEYEVQSIQVSSGEVYDSVVILAKKKGN